MTQRKRLVDPEERNKLQSSSPETLKKQAMWASEALILKLLVQCIVGSYRICIDNTDGVKVWIENETPEDKLTDDNKKKLIMELVRHIK